MHDFTSHLNEKIWIFLFINKFRSKAFGLKKTKKEKRRRRRKHWTGGTS
jgi:hypothetical protein